MKKVFLLVGVILFTCACSEEKMSEQLNSKTGQPALFDIDGNVYSVSNIANRATNPVSSSTSTIGQQTWATTNLNVSRYRNGDLIPEVTDQSQWEQITTGAWCYFNNDPANGPIYGKLYNWYAVNDPRGLAPAGYHIPSDSELTTLVSFLGGQQVAGGKMKANSLLWATPNIGVTANSQFRGLPGGFRAADNTDVEFLVNGQGGLFWSSTTVPGESYAWHVNIFNSQANTTRGAMGKRHGMSVRCIKN